jgi:hypothetical protein
MNKPNPKKSKKPKIEELIAARNPLERLAVKPLDPYQLPQPEAGQAPPAPEARTATEGRPRHAETGSEGTGTPSVEATATTRAAADTSASAGSREGSEGREDVVVPYSTHIRRSLIRGIKVRAFTSDRKDRQIVEAALEEYFHKHPADFS